LLSAVSRPLRSFVGSFVGSFVYSFVGSLVRWFVRSLVGSFVGSLVRWLVRSFVRSFTRSPDRSTLFSVTSHVKLFEYLSLLNSGLESIGRFVCSRELAWL
jgi:membrane protein YqaA with SNARE-associated domain